MGLKTYWFTLRSCGSGVRISPGAPCTHSDPARAKTPATTFRARRASERSKSSVKKVQRVFVIIHEVDALARDIDESEQGTGSHRAHLVQ
jgi:hypothetical protein